MDRCFIQKIVFVSVLSLPVLSWAGCPIADFFFKSGKNDQALQALDTCAMSYNDDESQVKLAQVYELGQYNQSKNPEKVLFYYQLAAEAGHAEAQVRLAELFMDYDKTNENRQKLLAYRKKVVPKSDSNQTFNGDFMHPYALLLLASEPTDKKWYYPSQTRIAPARTLSLMQKFNIDGPKKKKALKQASQWKTRKLLETAKEVVPSDIYSDLVTRLKNAGTQAKAMEELKKYTEDYIQKNKQIKGQKK